MDLNRVDGEGGAEGSECEGGGALPGEPKKEAETTLGNKSGDGVPVGPVASGQWAESMCNWAVGCNPRIAQAEWLGKRPLKADNGRNDGVRGQSRPARRDSTMAARAKNRVTEKQERAVFCREHGRARSHLLPRSRTRMEGAASVAARPTTKPTQRQQRQELSIQQGAGAAAELDGL